MENLQYFVDKDFVLSDDNLDILIATKLQKIQEQIEQNKEVDSKISKMRDY